MARSRLALWAIVGLVFVLAAAASVYQRLPYVTVDLAKGQVQWLTASTLKYVDNWERDGFFADRALLLERPRSIETPDPASREVYASYLPGFAVEVLLAHKLVPWLGLLNTIFLFGIASQLVVCIVCGSIVRRALADDEQPLIAAYFVLTAMLFYLLHREPMFLHAMLYHSFQAEILPFGLIVLLEMKRRLGNGDPRRLSWLITVTLGWLSVVDWMWVPICIVLSLLRLVSPIAQESLWRRCRTIFRQVWLLPLLIMAAYVGLLWQVGALGKMVARALLRTGVGADAGVSAARFFGSNLIVNLGPGLYFLLAAALIAAILLIRDRRDVLASAALLVLLPCFLYVALLPNDSVTHEFSILKFYFAMVVAVGALVPYRLMQLAVGWAGPRRLAVKTAALGLIVWFSTFYLIDFHSWPFWGDAWRVSFNRYFEQNPPPKTLPLALWLHDHARYEEVYFTLDSPIIENPPTALAISRKRVWQIDQPVARHIETLPPGAAPRFVASAAAKACLIGETFLAQVGDFAIYDGVKLGAAAFECLDRLPPLR